MLWGYSRRTGWLFTALLVVALLVVALLAALSLGSGVLAAGTGPEVTQDDVDVTATVEALLAKQREVEATLTAQAVTPTPSTRPPAAPATPTPTPTALPPTATRTPASTPTLRPVQPVAEALVARLNIRSGPGMSYSVIGNAALGQQFPIAGQVGGCAWLEAILDDGSTGWISGAPVYTQLNVACSELPNAAGSTPAPTAVRPTATATTARASSAAPTATSVASGGAALPGQITSFEPFGNWRRGDEPYGTLGQSTAQASSGAASAELRYDVPASAGGSSYVVFLPQPALRIPAGSQSLQMQVYGDGSGHYLNMWVGDAAGHTWQFTFGQINHTGWAPMTASLVPSRNWPNGPTDGWTGNELTEPLTLKAIVLDAVPDDTASSGVIYLDALSASSSAASSAGVAPSAAAPSEGTPVTQAATPSAPVSVQSGPLSGKIAVTRFNGNGMDTLIYDLAAGQFVAEIPNARQPDLAGGLLLVNGTGGGRDSIMRMTDGGGNVRPITKHPEDSYPQWSPSMASMVYASTAFGDRRSRLFWQEDASAQFEVGPMLYEDRELFGDNPIYLDNWRIAYQGCNTWAGASKCGIYTVDTRGSQPIQATTLTADTPTGNLGSQILFTSNREGSYDVWIVNSDGSGLRRLTDNPAADGLAVASPDGTQIAFVSNRGGTWSVYAMNTDGTNQRKLFDINGQYGSGDYEWYRERISWGP